MIPFQSNPILEAPQGPNQAYAPLSPPSLIKTLPLYLNTTVHHLLQGIIVSYKTTPYINPLLSPPCLPLHTNNHLFSLCSPHNLHNLIRLLACCSGGGELRQEEEMELDEQAFLEELFSLRRDAWEYNAMGDFFSPACAAMDGFQERNQATTVSVLPTFTASYEQPPPAGFDCLSEVYGNAAAAAFGPNAGGGDLGFLDVVEPKASMVVEGGGLGVCKVEPGLQAEGGGGFSAVAAPASKKKRVEGMPSKNLMAERRRRKRLNDRLSMLRSVVPKISKMDRTSILGDTIDYMKELLERIRQLQEEIEEQQQQETPGVLSVFRELNPNEMLARNTPKFDVERKEGGDTRVEIYCAAKPGLLLSTVSTLETLGLDIHQCVVSCFNDFGMHASCSEMQRERISADMIKQELFKNAGYGGGCL